GHAVGEVTCCIGLPCPYQRYIASYGGYKNLFYAIQYPRFLALRQNSANRCRRKEATDTCTPGPDRLTQRTLWQDLIFHGSALGSFYCIRIAGEIRTDHFFDL